MNIAGRIITRTDIAAAVVGSALGVTLAVAPGLVGQHHPAAASSGGAGQALPPTTAGPRRLLTATPTPPPRCDLPVAVSSTDAAATAESWADLYLSGPSATCPLPGWRHALNAAAGGSQLRTNPYTPAPRAASRVVGSATVTQCTAMLCSSGTLADISTIPVAPDRTVSGSDQANGRLRLNLDQQPDGRWLVTGSRFTPAGG